MSDEDIDLRVFPLWGKLYFIRLVSKTSQKYAETYDLV